MDKIVIGIPTINRADLLKFSLEDIAKKCPDIDHLIIIDNGNQNIKIPEELISITQVIKPGKNQGVAGSWNLMLKMAFNGYKADHLVLLNDDIVLGKTKKEIQDIIDTYPDYYIISGTQHWCAFIISPKAFKEIGLFDTQFYPAYFEDDDYMYRLRLAGKINLKNPRFDPRVFRNSMTIRKNPKLNKDFMKNKQRYIDKWGGEPRSETYTIPYNGNGKQSRKNSQ